MCAAKEFGIPVSGDLNEYKVKDLLEGSAPIDLFGVGTEMVTSKDHPALGAVRERAREELERLPPCYRKLESADRYPVTRSNGLKRRFAEMRSASFGLPEGQ